MSRINWEPMTRAFLSSESGAVVTDWVVLTAATMALSLGVFAVVSPGLEDLSAETAEVLSDSDVVFESQYFGQSVMDMALAMEVDNRNDAWKERRVDRVQSLSDQRLANQLNNWNSRTPENSNHSQERIDFEVRIRELETERRGT
ncbi:hypothetical protein GTA62_17475 [Roseobacter sp. HKCCD9010]|uniref:hypothetical protein n=1 Tax=unclassified Roseobacter TaxID=196798 RepID=UPI0014920796|nr:MULTISPECIES: hypothetical protein [unclassified Roseobacter]MBF9051464.1 hypothetical protein [Rhodobacterales bacterium HKCCD4356]NNV12988.1 hypothetical protein [Roseobacter sp. HKCCD7357]NNV17239.1 hypothetical protein [Roseobacter sp. HKCCD8768]NNV26845.1 hypothetical protein [Roseobacter sp. HKCCD8192]NNV30965.1 hypothetical protein [Roseobacter sp. HKCCD9061]